MKPIMALALTSLTLTTPLTAASEHPPKAEARALAQSLGSALKERLQQAIQQGGLPNGVTECHTEAIPVTQSLNKGGWTVGRTALRVRNPDNAPDAWETQQLEQFNAMLRDPSSAPLEATLWNAQTGEYRYMKAIVTQPVCTGCHGTSLPDDVKAGIEKYYPDDKATGFAAGSLRGAFTFTWSADADN